MARKLLGLVATGLLLGAVACGGGGGLDQSGLDDGGAPDTALLPGLDSLPAVGLGRRRVSDATYDLLLVEPVLDSGLPGVQQADGELILDSELGGGLAWAVYALPGFPTDGSIVPTALAVEKGLPEVWLGLSDYARGVWQFMQFIPPAGGNLIEGGADLLSDDGVLYVAVLAAADLVVVDSVRISTSAELPGAPVAVINYPDRILEGYEASFDAVGSHGGDGAVTELIWTFDTGDEQITGDPATVVTHTYETPGDHTVSVTVKNDLGRAGSANELLDVEEIVWVTDLLIVYNSDIAESEDLANYYASPLTGRAIPAEYMLGLPLADSETYEQIIPRATYESTIRDPIKAFLDDPPNADVKNNIKYLLMCKGVPHKIQGNNASVDSELCLLYEDGSYPLDSWVVNGMAGLPDDAQGFYHQQDTDFTPDTFLVTHEDSPLIHYNLNYLVGRLSAYTYDEAKLLVDRSLAADTSGTGWVICDSSQNLFHDSPQHYYDTMVDPVFIYPGSTSDELDSLEELLVAAGFSVFADLTAERIINGSEALPEEFVNQVIGYTGWGVNHSGGVWPNTTQYILLDLNWEYLPGACFMSYESYNGWNFDEEDIEANRHNQGQICDFLRMGGTVAVGNAWEPYTLGVGDERWVFNRYLNEGDRWIEAAYKGLRLLSWMEVVVGDPLCRVVAE